MRRQFLSTINLVAVGCTMLVGCNARVPDPRPPESPRIEPALPNIKLVAVLPQFTTVVNEIEIANSFDDVAPSWVIGAVVNIKTGKVHSLDGFLKAGTKLNTTPQTEVVFRDFIENSAVANAQWLDFVKGQVDATTRAEVTVAKTSKVSTSSENIDKGQLQSQATQHNFTPREDFGVIIGYSSYLVSASLFKSTEASGEVSGYGAKIGGNWFSKAGNLSAHHRVIATWAPLPFVVSAVANNIPGDLTKLTNAANDDGRLQLRKVEGLNIRLERAPK